MMKGGSLSLGMFLTCIGANAHRDRVPDIVTYRPLSRGLYSQDPPSTLPPYPSQAAFDAAFRHLSQATPFPIRLFRTTNYLNGPGEDLSSRVYTLNAHNEWEVNWDLTYTLRSAAQSWSPPQFTTYVPADHWNPHQVLSSGGGSHPPPTTQPPQPPQPPRQRPEIQVDTRENEISRR